MNSPKILVFDLETSPIITYTWGLFDQNIALNQIHEDWYVIAFAAKWLGDPPSKLIYRDQRNNKVVGEDTKLLKSAWELLDSCDILLTQNGKSFDQKKINAKFVLNGFPPPSSFKHIDTLRLAKKHFAFTSNKLEYMSDKLCKTYKKLKSTKFPGFALWRECLKGNKEAWKEMEKYNKHDVLALEELYKKMEPWDSSINFNVYRPELTNKCKCGSEKFIRNGFKYTSVGKFQRYKCVAADCGAETRDSFNLLSKEKRSSLRR